MLAGPNYNKSWVWLNFSGMATGQAGPVRGHAEQKKMGLCRALVVDVLVVVQVGIFLTWMKLGTSGTGLSSQ